MYMEGWTYVRTVNDVMAIKTKLLTSMGYHIFLTMVLRARKELCYEELNFFIEIAFLCVYLFIIIKFLYNTRPHW